VTAREARPRPSRAVAHPKRTGRTTLLTDAAQENIVRALRAGSHLKHAVEGFGIAYGTAARWMADGQAHADGTATTAQRQTLGSAAEQHAAPACTGLDELRPSGEVVRVCSSALHDYREFREAVVRARAEAVVTVVGRLQESAREGSVTAQLALLRAMAPEEYRPDQHAERPGPAAPGASGGPATSWRAIERPQATSWRAARGGGGRIRSPEYPR